LRYNSYVIPVSFPPQSAGGMLLGMGTMMLLRMDIATLYHDIRGQSVMKLYVIFNVLEV
jgi:hypothetical protein